MKKQSLLLLSAAFVLAGCGTKPQQSSSQPASIESEPISVPSSSEPESLPSSESVSLPESVEPSVPSGEGKFSELASDILENHNYSASVHCEVEGFEDEVYDDVFVNIDDDAYYNNFYSGHSGIIRQKGQGFVSFIQYENGIVDPMEFYCTNPDVGVSSVYDLVVENLFIGGWEKEGDNRYSNNDENAIAVALNFSGWSDSAYLIAPEKIYGSVSDNGEDLVISADLSFWYYDEEEKNPHGNVTITVGKIGSSTNEKVESYVNNPTKEYTAQTAWSDDDKSLFATRFNGKVPSFLEGASYSMTFEDVERDGMHQAFLNDYACGNKMASYGDALVKKDGFTKISDSKYTLVEKDTAAGRTTTYTVEMGYADPSKARGAHTVGYYYPNGVFQAYFYAKTVNNAVDSVSALNKYMQDNDIDEYVPLLPFGDTCTKVANFVDKTADMNAQYATDEYFFYTNTTYTRFYFGTANEAKEAASSYVEALKQCGYTRKSSFMGIVNCGLEEDNSYVAVTDPDSISASSYSGYIQIRWNVYTSVKEAIDPVDPSAPTTKELTGIVLSGMSTKYNVNDLFYFDGTVTARYSDGTNKTVTSMAEVEEYPDMETVGEKTIKMNYTEGTKTVSSSYVITVSQPTVAIPLSVQSNDKILSSSLFDGNHNTVSTYDYERDSGYVFASFTCVEGYVVTSLSVLEDSSATCEYNDYASRWEIKPNAGNLTSVTIVATVEEGGYSLSVDTSLVGGSIKVITPSLSAPVLADTAVRFSVSLDEGYELKNVFIVGDDSVVMTKNPMGNNSYSFLMPSHDATISATIEKVGGGEEETPVTPDASTSPLAACGNMNLVDQTEDSNLTLTAQFNEDGTGSTRCESTNVLGTSYIAHNFSWSQTQKEGTTYSISIADLTQTAKSGTVQYSFKNIESIEVVYNEALTQVVSVTVKLNYVVSGELVATRTFVYEA